MNKSPLLNVLAIAEIDKYLELSRLWYICSPTKFWAIWMLWPSLKFQIILIAIDVYSSHCNTPSPNQRVFGETQSQSNTCEEVRKQRQVQQTRKFPQSEQNSWQASLWYAFESKRWNCVTIAILYEFVITDHFSLQHIYRRTVSYWCIELPFAWCTSSQQSQRIISRTVESPYPFNREGKFLFKASDWKSVPRSFPGSPPEIAIIGRWDNPWWEECMLILLQCVRQRIDENWLLRRVMVTSLVLTHLYDRRTIDFDGLCPQ